MGIVFVTFEYPLFCVHVVVDKVIVLRFPELRCIFTLLI